MAYPTYNKPQISSAPTYRGGAFREMPTYSGPGWNEGEITGLAQRRAAPGLRALRTQLKRVTRGGDATRRLSLRDALAGYGQGVGSVIGSASTAAGNEYGDKYSALSAGSLSEYRSRAEAASAFNERGQDIARTNYGGEMAEWGARTSAESRGADMDYASRVRGWEAETDLEKTKYLTKAQAERDIRLAGLSEQSKTADFGRQTERDRSLFELNERARRGDVDAQRERDQLLAELTERARRGDVDAQRQRDLLLSELSEQGKKSDYQRQLDERAYGEDTYQKRRREAEEQKKINYAWDKWKANNPIKPTNPMGNYQYLSNTGTGR